MNEARSAQALLAEASQARQQGRLDEALSLVANAIKQEPAYTPAWNLQGLIELDRGAVDPAIASFRAAAAQDLQSPIPAFNLSRALRVAQHRDGELEALEQALSRDPYFLPAIFAKGEVLRTLGRDQAARQLYRLVLQGISDLTQLTPALRKQAEEAREFLQQASEQDAGRFADALAAIQAAYPQADMQRAQVFAEERAGRRKIYSPQPLSGHFPFVPPYEFFPRELFPWFQALEAQTGEIRAELLSLWQDLARDFRPYVQFGPGEPLNQWSELNRSPRWSAYFFWENGRPNQEHSAACPKTAALLRELPMLDLPGKGPTAMFSVLEPKTRIPAHTGSTNARTTVHLPLVVPTGCGFRVGGESRNWIEGQAWAFDDTIEHEAWNDSDQPRAILIIDVWNPFLSEAEREVVRRIG